MLKKMLSILLTLCLSLGLCVCSFADETADFEGLLPLMDLVCSASQYSANAPEILGGEDTELSASFVDAFFKVGCAAGLLDITEATLTDTGAQAELLGSVFAAKVPALGKIDAVEDLGGYIGFKPVSITNAADGAGLQIIGEMYLADKPMSDMATEDFLAISWLDRAIFVLQPDETARGGYRIVAYSVGTDLTYEAQMQAYYEELVVEYESRLGFMLSYPSVFGDELLREDENGCAADLPDGSAHFFARRMDNTNAASLSEYVTVIANGITDSVCNINEEMQYATLAYTTDEGDVVFDVFILTDKYIFQAEISYPAAEQEDYSLYNSYLENSFVVNEVSQG